MKTSIEKLQAEYDAAFRAEYSRVYPADKNPASPGEHYAGQESIAAVRVGNMSEAQAISRAREFATGAARNVAEDRMTGNVPPSALRGAKNENVYHD